MMNCGAVRDRINCGPRAWRSIFISQARTRSPGRRFSFGIIWSRGKQSLDATGLDDGIATLHALDRAGDEMFLAIEEVVEHLLALGIADLLQDHLLGGLRADATKIDRLERFLDVVADLHVGIILARIGQTDLLGGNLDLFVIQHQPAAKGLVFAGLAVDLDAHVGFVVDTLLGRGSERKLEGIKHDVLVDVLFPCQGIDQ